MSRSNRRQHFSSSCYPSAPSEDEVIIMNQPNTTRGTRQSSRGQHQDTYVMTTMTEGMGVMSLGRSYHSREEEDAAYNSSYPSTASGSLKDLSRPHLEEGNRQEEVLRMMMKKKQILDHQETQEERNLEKSFYLQQQEVMKFKSPRDECSPEDCCCCFYFLYLLFNQEIKPPAFDGSSGSKVVSNIISSVPVVKSSTQKMGMNQDKVLSSGGPGYSYFRNISTGSSIDSKSSWMGAPDTQDNKGQEKQEPAVGILVDTASLSKDPSENDDNESDGWLGVHASIAQGSPASNDHNSANDELDDQEDNSRHVSTELHSADHGLMSSGEYPRLPPVPVSSETYPSRSKMESVID